MEALKSAIVTRARSRAVVTLGPDALDVWTVLCESGPVLELGEIRITPDIWQLVPRNIVWMAVDLHEVGYFGDVCDETWASNELSVNTNGSILSAWKPSNAPEFWVLTERQSYGPNTEVFIRHDYAS